MTDNIKQTSIFDNVPLVRYSDKVAGGRSVDEWNALKVDQLTKALRLQAHFLQKAMDSVDRRSALAVNSVLQKDQLEKVGLYISANATLRIFSEIEDDNEDIDIYRQCHDCLAAVLKSINGQSFDTDIARDGAVKKALSQLSETQQMPNTEEQINQNVIQIVVGVVNGIRQKEANLIIEKREQELKEASDRAQIQLRRADALVNRKATAF